ncbi:glutathione S-transferase 1-like isoform X2 [Diabrotica virgifera virgifera]|uniref:Glutathione S-transferase 1-like n=2 Tax=Diabrotica virgifera virgifera TaxID=50390 RepID=A0ABM5KYN3_DIAVI|nr:glutathione S-transferase 1-like isoform X1 [Diabrotica virgifera virgifera]XP_050515299.1 glutathione S-transferase 1-like isoform X2 [Diabrotica virgifera virgifera]
MAPKIYGDVLSPCVRAVLITAKALNIEIEYIPVNVIKKEQLSAAYLEMNQQHTVPTLDDDGIIIWDSHAIMIYLAEKYGKGNPLYPTDVAKRAKINRLLFFECGEIFSMHRYLCSELLFLGKKEISKDIAAEEEKALQFLERFLKDNKYVAGDEMTIADFSIWTTLSNASNMVPIKETIFPRITEWIKMMNQQPYREINEPGATRFKSLIDAALKK